LLMEKRDQACIWAKHCDPGIRAAITELFPEEQLIILVNGKRTIWARMKDGKDGRPTLGLKLVGGRSAWNIIPMNEICDIHLVSSTEAESESRTL